MHHGEFKTPGGKLVAVDFDVRNGEFAGVLVHGDFFLYPDDAFEDLAAALEGAPVGEPDDVVAARIRTRLRTGAELLGTSPEGIATAVARALAAGPVNGGVRS